MGIPAGMQKAMARQAEAERERRAKIINAEGEFQAAQRLFDAAEIIGGNPAALQLRYLQTLIEVANNEDSTIVLPVPIDLIRPLLEHNGGQGERRQPARRPERPEEASLDAAEETSLPAADTPLGLPAEPAGKDVEPAG